MSLMRTIATPCLSVRTMMFSNSSGLVSKPWAVTTNCCSTPAGIGGAPIWPTPNAWFWLWIALAISCTVIPSWAIRSGRSHTRIAMSGDPNTEERFAPGMRFNSSSTYRLV